MRFVRRKRRSVAKLFLHETLVGLEVSEEERKFNSLVKRMKNAFLRLSDKLESALEKLYSETMLSRSEVYRVFPVFPGFIYDISKNIEKYGGVDIKDVRNSLLKGLELTSSDASMYDFILFLYEKKGKPEQIELLKDLASTVKEPIKEALTQCDNYFFEAQKQRLTPAKFKESEKKYYNCITQVFKPYIPRIEEHINNINPEKLEKELKTFYTIFEK